MRKLLMASVVLTTFAISMTLFQISSCTKADAESPAVTSIHGLWIGTYTVDGMPDLGEQYFSFIIKPDGTMINDTKGANKQHLAPGTWNLNGSVLSCTFTCVYGSPSNIGITETSTAVWDNKDKLATGIWKNVGPLAGSGKFSLTKVN